MQTWDKRQQHHTLLLKLEQACRTCTQRTLEIQLQEIATSPVCAL